jgi:hypothetical protein
MPYYRILVWTKRRQEPYKGIRVISDANINAVYQKASNEAFTFYRQDFIDCEVQMLSKLCKAVKDYEKGIFSKPYPPLRKA